MILKRKSHITLVLLLSVFLAICSCAGNKQTIESTTHVVPKTHPAQITPESRMVKPVN